ncbi:MAG: TolC family protein [Bacteroidales bacterium]
MQYINKLKTALLLMALVAAPMAPCQEQWSLDQCITYAIEHNIRLKQKQLGIEATRNDLRQSRLGLLPSLNAGLNQSFRFGRSVDPLTYEFTTENSKGASFYVFSDAELFRGFEQINAIQKNRIDLERNLQELEQARNDLSLEITRLFLQILFNEELYQVVIQQRDISVQQVDRTRKLVDAGTMTRGDQLEIQAQLAMEELNVVNVKNQLDLSYLELAQLLDLPSAEDFRIRRPELTTYLIDEPFDSNETVYQSALTYLPQIRVAELNLRSLEKELSLAEGRKSPRLTMSSAYGTGYSDRLRDYQTGLVMPLRDQLDFTSQASLGFGLNIPVFNSWKAQMAVRNARLGLENGKYQLELARNQVRKEIQQSSADAAAALNRYRATEQTVAALEEAFRYTGQKYDVGLLTSLDFNVAKNNLTRARSELLQAKYHYLFNRRILDFYRGIPIDLR